MADRTVEIHLIRLLKKCEEMGEENNKSLTWKLEKYVGVASSYLTELKQIWTKADGEILLEYQRRIDFLKKLVDSQKLDDPVERIMAVQMMPHGTSTPDGVITRELHQKTVSAYNADIRRELLGSDEGSSEDLRLRRTQSTSGDDIDSILKHHHNMREKIAEDMLLMTQALKEQTQLAGTIIKKDIETLQKSSSIAEKHLGNLKVHSDSLVQHNKRAWRWWMWIVILATVIIFIDMIIFMRVMKKKK